MKIFDIKTKEERGHANYQTWVGNGNSGQGVKVVCESIEDFERRKNKTFYPKSGL